MRRLSALLIVLLIITVAAACETATTPEDPQTVATKYLQATVEGRYGDAYKLLSADSQAQVSSEEYTRRMERTRKDAKIRDLLNLNVQKANTANNLATVPYSVDITLEDGSSSTLFESLRLLRQGNNWLVIWPPY